MFVIATKSRRREEMLFMVDRNKQRASFWSNRLDDAMQYGDKGAAQRKAAALKFNSPCVLSLQDAARIARAQEDERIHDEAMSSCEMGWDGHKGVF